LLDDSAQAQDYPPNHTISFFATKSSVSS